MLSLKSCHIAIVLLWSFQTAAVTSFGWRWTTHSAVSSMYASIGVNRLLLQQGFASDAALHPPSLGGPPSALMRAKVDIAMKQIVHGVDRHHFVNHIHRLTFGLKARLDITFPLSPKFSVTVPCLNQTIHLQPNPPPKQNSTTAPLNPNSTPSPTTPMDPTKRYHDGIFIETDPTTGQGTLFNVTGDIIAASGMRYEVKESWMPGQDSPVHRITQLGWVRRADFDSGAVGEVLRCLPSPTRQQGINFWEVDAGTGRHELVWTKESGELYGPGEQRRPAFKCNEWTAEYAIPALRSSGILVSTTGS